MKSEFSGGSRRFRGASGNNPHSRQILKKIWYCDNILSLESPFSNFGKPPCKHGKSELWNYPSTPTGNVVSLDTRCGR